MLKTTVTKGKFPKSSAPQSKIPVNAKLITTGGVGKNNGKSIKKGMC